MEDLSQYRSEFKVCETMAYLNHAGVAPISARAARAMTEVIEETQAWGALRYKGLFARVERARQSAATLLDTRPDRVAFIKNTSEGIGFVAQGFPWRPGDVVVVPEGEFPANVYPWLNLKRLGVDVTRVPLHDGRLLLADFERCLDQQGVRMLAVSSMEFETGFVNDLEALGHMCRERGIFFFVDGIQTVGWREVHPERLGIDALALDGHKWLMGPEGAGLFYVSERAMGMLEVAEVGWNSVKNPLDFSNISFELRRDAARFECGSYGVVLVAGLGAAIDLLLEVGLSRIEHQVLALTDRMAEEVAARQLTLFSSRRKGEKGAAISFGVGRAPERVASELAARKVFVAARGNGIRVSPHFYNNEEDIERLFHALDEVYG